MSIKLQSKTWTFTCDGCGNTHTFWHGMETWSLVYEQDGQRIMNHDERRFCSESCARSIYLTEKKEAK